MRIVFSDLVIYFLDLGNNNSQFMILWISFIWFVSVFLGTYTTTCFGSLRVVFMSS